MSTCDYEEWTLKQVSEALENRKKENKIIKVPRFQRSIVWKDSQSEIFIDSINKGFPIGTLLFAKEIKNNQESYTLIDGLQRSNTIKTYIKNPTKLFSDHDLNDQIIDDINKVLDQICNQEIIKGEIKNLLKDKIQSNAINDIETSDLADALRYKYPVLHEQDKYNSIKDVIKPFLKKYKKRYEDICGSKIPVIIYSWEEENLPDIFERINNQGTALTKYQIYAASWREQIIINNDAIMGAICDNYDAMLEKDFVLKDYDRETLEKTRQFSIYEYVFGFGKFICKIYPNMFENNDAPDKINPIGFELLTACFGKNGDEIKSLNKLMCKVDIDQFEKSVIDTIKFVDDLLKPYTGFVGNNRKDKNKIFHSRNQIISIIASTFLERYNKDNFQSAKKSWKSNKKILEENIPLHYVFDIIFDEWKSGVTNKTYKILNNNKYLKPIPKDLWDTKLNDWFIGQLSRSEAKKVHNPQTIDLLFLNCIYLDIFRAKDQLSQRKFDVEHIATKKYMSNIIVKNDWEGQPVSCISNLCYLSEPANRSKKEHNFY